MRVIIESPYAGDIEANVTYARRCVRDSVLRGEAPIASHLLFTQPGILDDSIPEERTLGIKAGLAWIGVAHYSIFYTDRGWSRGMRGALTKSLNEQRDNIKIRALDNTPTIPPGYSKMEEEFLRSCIEI